MGFIATAVVEGIGAIGSAIGAGAAEVGGAAALGGAAAGASLDAITLAGGSALAAGAGGGLLSGAGGALLAGAGGLALGGLFKGPQVPNPGVDPTLGAAKNQATQTLQQQLQVEAAGDTASIMARYGTRLALSGSIPAAATPAAVR